MEETHFPFNTLLALGSQEDVRQKTLVQLIGTGAVKEDLVGSTLKTVLYSLYCTVPETEAQKKPKQPVIWAQLMNVKMGKAEARMHGRAASDHVGLWAPKGDMGMS